MVQYWSSGLRVVLSGSLGSEKGARAWALVYFREAISRGWFCVHPSHPARQRALLLLAVTAAMQPDDQSGSPTMGVCRYRAASWILPRRDRLPCLSPTLGPHDEDTACLAPSRGVMASMFGGGETKPDTERDRQARAGFTRVTSQG